jgi:hypothetical protein
MKIFILNNYMIIIKINILYYIMPPKKSNLSRRSHAYDPSITSYEEFKRLGEEKANVEVAKLVQTPSFKRRRWKYNTELENPPKLKTGKYIDERTTTKGDKVTSAVATRVLNELLDTDIQKEIFSIYEGELDGSFNLAGKEITSGEISKFGGILIKEEGVRYIFQKIKRGGISLNNHLTEGASNKNEKDRPIVIMISSKVHSLIYILYEGVPYTVGFGYWGDIQNQPYSTSIIRKGLELTVPSMADGVYGEIKIKAGAIYSSDHAWAKDNQSSQISYIGYMNPTFVKKMNKYLNRCTEIRYPILSSRLDTFIVGNECILTGQNLWNYQRAAEYFPLNVNCIKFAIDVLGLPRNYCIQNLNLKKGGPFRPNNPGVCPSITNKEWENFVNAYHTSSDNLEKVINSINKRINSGAKSLIQSAQSMTHDPRSQRISRRETRRSGGRRLTVKKKKKKKRSTMRSRKSKKSRKKISKWYGVNN